MPLFGFDKGKTFKPMKAHGKEKTRTLHSYAAATLGSGDLVAAVRLPEGEDESEWLACHVVDFYNAVSLMYGTGGFGRSTSTAAPFSTSLRLSPQPS